MNLIVLGLSGLSAYLIFMASQMSIKVGNSEINCVFINMKVNVCAMRQRLKSTPNVRRDYRRSLFALLGKIAVHPSLRIIKNAVIKRLLLLEWFSLDDRK